MSVPRGVVDSLGRPFDISILLRELPITPLRAVHARWQRQVAIKQWAWPEMPPYNGFTGIERVRAWQLGWFLRESFALPWEKMCSVCGARGSMQSHAENYYDITREAAICKRCHGMVHKRFKQPAAWQAMIRPFVSTGHEWFAVLPMAEVDVGAVLRSQFGEGVRELMHSPLFFIPPGVRAPIGELAALPKPQPATKPWPPPRTRTRSLMPREP